MANKKKNAKDRQSGAKSGAKSAANSGAKSYVHIITGDGGGKTTSALGVAMRSLGQGRKVGMVQFMKGRKDIGEWKIQKKLEKVMPGRYEVFQFGRKEFVNLKKPSLKDAEAANEGLGFAKEFLREKAHPDVLILDEINLALALGLLNIKDVVHTLQSAAPGVDIYMTGRRAPKELYAYADYVTVVEDEKRPKKIITRKGIDY
ncbi:TPA: cob(I)yrinic acid a,c-diamide adenosyltransferase [Candidatus Woesearchaeota archaeon]|nr:cob(I)yrinic acid a,c-diamide adenosyltransferase [Candidatus Woesearchaeota archaeon]